MFKKFIFSLKKSKILSKIAKNENKNVDLSNLTYWSGENFQVNDFDEYNSNLFISNKMLTSF